MKETTELVVRQSEYNTRVWSIINLARPTCILIKLYCVAPQSWSDPIWVLMPRRDRNDFDRFVECNATLWLRLVWTWCSWWRRWWILIGTCSCTSLLASLYHTFPFIIPIVLELCRVSWNLLKISCRYARIGSAVGSLTLVLTESVRIGPNNADSHQELAPDLWIELGCLVLRDCRP